MARPRRGRSVACTVLLHDAVEDHVADIAGGACQAALAVPAGRFGQRTAGLVAGVTNPAWGARPR